MKRDDVKRETAPVSAALVLTSIVILFAPALLQPDGLIYPARDVFTDLTITHWPAFQYLRDALSSTGMIPLWRTSILGGTPFAADPTSGLWYPPNWLAVVLPLEWFFKLVVVAHLWLGGWAMTRLAQSFGAGRIGATVAGVAYAIAPRAVGHAGVGHLTLVEAWAWMPLAAWALRRDTTWKGAVASGAMLGLCALADVRAAVYAGIILISYVLFIIERPITAETPAANRSGEGASRSVSEVALAKVLKPSQGFPDNHLARGALLLAASAVVSAATWLPALSLATESTRAGLLPEDARRYSLGAESFVGLLLANRGDPEGMTFVGLAVLMLGAVGLGRLWRERQRAAMWLTALIVVGAVAGLGFNLPLYEWVARLPGLSLLRVPARAWFMAAFAFPLAAGLGVEALMQRPVSHRLSKKWRLAGLIVGWFALLFGVIGAAVAFSDGRAGSVRAGYSLIGFGVFLPLAIVLALLRSDGRLAPSRFGALVLAVVAADLMWVGWGQYRVMAIDEAFADGRSVAEYLRASVSEDVSNTDAGYRVYSPSYSLPQHVAQAHGIELADGIDPMQLARTVRFMQAATGVGEWSYSVTLPAFEGEQEVDVRTWLKDVTPDPALLGQLGVRYVVAHFRLEHPDLIEMASIGHVRVYRNRRVMPQAWVAGHVDVVGDAAQAIEWLKSRDTGNAAVVEGGPPLDVRVTEQEARVDVVEPDRIVASARGPGLLVLSEVYERDWRASIDGAAAEIVPTNGVLRGVVLPEGEHRVELVYDPAAVKVGVVMSGIGWAGLFVVWRARRTR